MPPEAVNLASKLGTFSEHWSPKIVSRFNGCDVMVVKALGKFNWHHHEETDDFFLVLKGTLRIEMREGMSPSDRANSMWCPRESNIARSRRKRSTFC